MANTRQYLAGIIGLIGGAWAAGAEARRRQEKSEHLEVTSEQNPFPSLSGKKGGTVVSTRPAAAPAAPPAAPVKSRPQTAERFGTAKNRGKEQEPPTADYDPECEGEKPVSEPGSEVKHTDVAAIDGSFGYVKELFKRFNGDHCPAWAAALSFFSILSFVPILICGIAVLGLLIQDPQTAAEKVEQFLMNLIPGKSASESAKSIMAQADIQKHAANLMNISGWASVIGILSLFWAASRIFANAATPMNAAFRTTETRGFVKMQIYAIGLMIGAGALFLLSLVPSSGPDLMRAMPWFHGIPDPSPPWLDVIFLLLGVAINAAMFTVIYRYLPSPKADVDWKEAAFGGVIVAVLWEIAKQGFALYLRRFGGSDGYDKVYGAMGGLIILVLWVYYSSMILLLGAEIAKLYSDVRDAKAKGVKA